MRAVVDRSLIPNISQHVLYRCYDGGWVVKLNEMRRIFDGQTAPAGGECGVGTMPVGQHFEILFDLLT